jgi:hypothetical protein
VGVTNPGQRNERDVGLLRAFSVDTMARQHRRELAVAMYLEQRTTQRNS